MQPAGDVAAVEHLLICILTPVSAESEWVRFELGAA
jgi:hypothetical protein